MNSIGVIGNAPWLSGGPGRLFVLGCVLGTLLIAPYPLQGAEKRPPDSAPAEVATPPDGAGADSSPGFSQREDRYRVQPGDVLEFQFRFTPEYNQTVKVQPDGYIPLQEAGELKVGGLTVREVREATVQAYRENLRDPVISIILKEFSMPYYVVGGEVGKPGRYELKGDVMLSEAIQIAGGFSAKAQTTDVLLFRRVSKEWVETKRVNFKEQLKNGLQEDVRLRPGDSIYVSASKMGKVQRFMESSKLGLFFNPLVLF